MFTVLKSPDNVEYPYTLTINRKYIAQNQYVCFTRMINYDINGDDDFVFYLENQNQLQFIISLILFYN